MVIITTAKVKEQWKSRSLNKKKLKTYWHALYQDCPEYTDALTAQRKNKGR